MGDEFKKVSQALAAISLAVDASLEWRETAADEVIDPCMGCPALYGAAGFCVIREIQDAIRRCREIRGDTP